VTAPPRTGFGDAVRLALGTLTILPVRAPVVDRVSAGRAMVLAPLVGLGLAVPAGLLGRLAPEVGLSPVLTGALVIGLLALLTRGMHLDGLADTADGLGSGRPAPAALEVMRRGDVGPFGVVTLVLVLLVQVTALAQLVAEGSGVAGLAAALVVSRLALPLACLRGVPSARPDGLGATVAGSVSRSMTAIAVLLAVVAIGVGVLAGQTTSGSSLVDVAWGVVPAPLGLLAGLALGARAVRRLGGITGDVLGAVVEVTLAAALVALCLP
jgi:adenosylcobinamide-GDP ribazoletransferase